MGSVSYSIIGYRTGRRGRELAGCGEWHSRSGRRYALHIWSSVSITFHALYRLLSPSTVTRYKVIRHHILVLDLSQSMLNRDMRPTRFDLMLEYSRAFIIEWLDQNPLGQIGVVGVRVGIAERMRRCRVRKCGTEYRNCWNTEGQTTHYICLWIPCLSYLFQLMLYYRFGTPKRSTPAL